jgi:hypothetical protein
MIRTDCLSTCSNCTCFQLWSFRHIIIVLLTALVPGRHFETNSTRILNGRVIWPLLRNVRRSEVGCVSTAENFMPFNTELDF